LTDSRDIYKNGIYVEQNPSWHQEHSLRKAHELYEAISRNIQELTIGSTEIKICEIGCGYGGVLYHFSDLLERESGVRTKSVGIDLSPGAVESAKSAYGNHIHFICGDIDNLEEPVDLMLLVDVVEHVKDAKTFVKKVAEKTHWLLMRLPLENNLWNMALGKKKQLLKKHGHLHSYTFGSALKLLDDVEGIQIVEMRFTRNFMDPSNCATFVSRFMKWPRLFLSAISPRLNSFTLGGQSLIALINATRLPGDGDSRPEHSDKS
jgi:SAM-dependent methyltransferase